MIDAAHGDVLTIEGQLALKRRRGFRGWRPSEIGDRLMETTPDWLVLRDLIADDESLSSLATALELALCRKVTPVLAGQIDVRVLPVVAGAVYPRPVFVLPDAELSATGDLHAECLLNAIRGVEVSLGMPRDAAALLADGLVDAVVSERAMQTTFLW